MRANISILIILILASVCNCQPTCTATQFLKDSACIECNDLAKGGIANCNTCSYLSNTYACKTCIAGYIFKDSSCQACTSNCAECTDVEGETDKFCKTCLKGYFKVAESNSCSQCAANCNVCSQSPGAEGEDQNCVTCADGFFKGSKNECVTCDSTCASCKGNLCVSCKTEGHLLNRPVDDGKCVAPDTCVAPKAVGTLSPDVKVCSQFGAPTISTSVKDSITVDSASGSLISVESLCSPVSTSDQDKQTESVGAVVVVTANTVGQKAIDVFNVREEIRKANSLMSEDLSKQNYLLKKFDTNWLNIVGTKEGLAPLTNFQVPRGRSVLNFVCVNSLNVASPLKSVNITNNVAYNPYIKYIATFLRPFNLSSLNNLTCLVAQAVYPSQPELQQKVTNILGDYCNQTDGSWKNYTNWTLLDSVQDYSFLVNGSQFDDNFEKNVKSKTSDVQKAITDFAKALNLTILYGPEEVVQPLERSYKSPALNVTVPEANDSKAIINIFTNEFANIWLGVVKGDNRVNVENLRGNSTNGTVFKSYFKADANSSTNVTVSGLESSSTYNIYYYVNSKFDPFLNTDNLLKKVSFNTIGSSSFSCVLALNVFVLSIVLLFI